MLPGHRINALIVHRIVWHARLSAVGGVQHAAAHRDAVRQQLALQAHLGQGDTAARGQRQIDAAPGHQLFATNVAAILVQVHVVVSLGELEGGQRADLFLANHGCIADPISMPHCELRGGTPE